MEAFAPDAIADADLLADVLADVLNDRALFAAWEHVRANDGCAGVDGESIAQFSQNALGRLQQLQAEVARGLYRPQPLQAVPVPKAQGGVRVLAIPAVRDRVLQTAVARQLGPRLDPGFDDASFGYRPGRSVAMAVQRVVRHRDAGLRHVLDADIEAFFDHINHAVLLAALRERLPQAGPLMPLIELWLAADLRRLPQGEGRLLERGVPQGSPLSPLLANLYLHPLDAALRAAGLAAVRYADDFVVLADDHRGAHAALAVARQVLDTLHLRLHPGKTRITSFDAGFKFLGVRFVQRMVEPVNPAAAPWLTPRRPAPKADGRPAGRLLASLDPALSEDDESEEDQQSACNPATREPLLHTLYVTEPGAAVTKEHDRVVVSVRREVRASVPLGQLDQIAVMHNALVSTALLRECAARRIAVAFSGPGGEIATLERSSLPEQALVALQWQSQANPDLHHLMARQFLEGKLHNARTVLRRFSRRDGREAVHPHLLGIDDCQHRLANAADLNTLRGLEGTAARHYFEALRGLLPAGVEFPARQRRPPRDPVNVLLSLGYTVLTHTMHALLRLAGLNPHIGHLHRTAPGGLALASDLIEEFRAPVVDAVVWTLLRQGEIGPQHFEWDETDEQCPCRLRSEARRAFVRALETKLDSTLVHPRLQTAMDYRRAMQAQVRHYRDVLAREVAVYQPFKLR